MLNNIEPTKSTPQNRDSFWETLKIQVPAVRSGSASDRKYRSRSSFRASCKGKSNRWV